MIQSEVFYFAKKLGVSKVNSKNVEQLVSLIKSKELTKRLFQIDGHFGLRQGRKGSPVYLHAKSLKCRACGHDFTGRAQGCDVNRTTTVKHNYKRFLDHQEL